MKASFPQTTCALGTCHQLGAKLLVNGVNWISSMVVCFRANTQFKSEVGSDNEIFILGGTWKCIHQVYRMLRYL